MKLKEITIKLDKSKIKAGDGKSFGSYPLFTCSPVLNKYCDDYLYDTDAIIIGTGGNPVINYFNGKFNVSTDCLTLKVKDNYICKYIYYLLLANINKIQDMFRGAGIKHLNKNEFLDLEIIDLSKKEQKLIVSKLDIIQEIIKNKQQQLRELEEVVKSQFVELFGTLNNSKWEIKKLEDLTLKITDGKHGGCEREENSGYYFVGATEIYNNRMNYENANQITKKDFEKDYTRCDLKINDFVIVNTGATIGKSAIIDDEICKKVLLQKSVALIRVKEEILLPIFLKYCYECNPSLYSKGQGCARVNLLLSQIKNTMIPVPPIELQNQFAEFVKLIDKQKFEIQKSLDEIKNLQKSLMNKYFGG